MALRPIHKAAGAGVLALTLVASFEGVRTHAYRDSVGIATVCYGETRGVHMGDTKSLSECNAMLGPRLAEFEQAVDSCVHVPMSDNRKAALISFAYNVGVQGMCHSQVVRRLNAGDPNACDGLLAYNHAGGKVLPGLTRRRETEHSYCQG